ncbi:caspase family protein [Streptomyces swartbergensis]|uniref:caspase family protein n=1 Tax=Streptomyces swartbergensis TaxID=487165 RepID=UPI0038047F1C
MIRLPDPERSRAFLFGAATYRYGDLTDLPAVANNLRDLRAALTPPLGGFAPEHSTVLLDPDEPRAVYGRLAHHAAQAKDTLLVYFAGHGLRKMNGGLRLAVTTTLNDDAQYSAFDYDDLHEIVYESDAANKIVILDCCFSGRAVQGMSAGTALEQRTAIDGACVLVSSTPYKESLAPPGAVHTTYTGELLHLLRHGVPDAGDLLSLGTLAEHLRDSPRLRRLQTPGHRFVNTTRHLALARNPAASASGATPAPAPPPPPRISPEQAYVARPLVLAGVPHATKKDLAATVRTHWKSAADRFFRRMGSEAHPSEGWGELRSWLRQFDNPRTDDVEGRIVLIDRYLTNRNLPGDHKLLHLLRWLDPDGPVVYRGRPITYETLTRACLAGYTGGGDRDARFVEELSETPLLDVLARFGTLRELRGVRQKWLKELKEWKAATGSASLPPEVHDWAAATGPGALLAALLPPRHLAEVRHRLPAETGPPDPAVGWYSRLLPAAGGRDTLLGRLAEAQWSARAQWEGVAAARERERQLRAQKQAAERHEAEVQRRREERRRAEERERERRLRTEQEAEQRRLREREWRAAREAELRPGAVTLAVLRAFGLAVGWAFVPTVVIWITWWYGSYEFDGARTLTLMAVLVSFSSLFGLVPCAYRLGGVFRPRLRVPWSWLPPARTALTTGALLLGYGLIGGDTSLRSDDIKADSDLLRTVELDRFLDYVGQSSYSPSGWDILISLLLLPLLAGCVLLGAHAGRATARRWEHHARLRLEEHGHMGLG